MNYVRLTDLDDLALTVRDTDSKLYIGEAINAYRAGVFRAAIMSTWIAVATDIISKIRELSAQGDMAAQLLITELDSAVASNNIKQLQLIEGDLLTKARNDFEFLSQQEHGDLERLKEDRNYCAHPAFVAEGVLFQPMPDLVRAHIVHAITHLLQQQPVQGKSALKRIFAEIARPSFPNDLENVKKILGAKYLERAKQSLVKNLLAALLKAFLTADVDIIGREQAVINSLVVISEIHPAVYEETLKEKLTRVIDVLDDVKAARLFRLIGANDKYWTLLDEPSQIRVKGILKNFSLSNLAEHNVLSLIDFSEFKTIITEKIEAVTKPEKEKVIASNPHPDFADLTIDLYSEAADYREAERLSHGILLPMVQYFNAEQILRILEIAVENRYIKFAGESPDVFADFFDKTLEHLNDTKEGWLRFINALPNDPTDRFSYPKLRGKLIERGIIARTYPPSENRVAASDDEIPF
jgi:hypothetical protein